MLVIGGRQCLEKGTPGRYVVLQHGDERFRKREVKDIRAPVFLRHFEFFIPEGNPPASCRVFVEMFAYLHLTHVALAIGSIGPQTQHQSDASLDSRTGAWM